MSFFNKKEDVIKIELTPYGRHLLSKGKLMPAYYAFFDDDILYDAEHGGQDPSGLSENQSNIRDRIINNTPRLKPFRDLDSPEEVIFSQEPNKDDYSKTKVKQRLLYLTEPLGTSDQTKDAPPMWDTTFLQGEIQTSAVGLTSSAGRGSPNPPMFGAGFSICGLWGGNPYGTEYHKQIPQINATIEYTLQTKNNNDNPPVRGQKISQRAPASRIYPDGTYIELLEEQILCQLLENNGFFHKDNLEVEVYMYDQQACEKNWIPLRFLPSEKKIQNDILKDTEEQVDDNMEFGPSYVEYYINFLTDEDIPTTDICTGINKLKDQDVLLNIDVDCEERVGVDFDIYRSKVTQEDIEDCD